MNPLLASLLVSIALNVITIGGAGYLGKLWLDKRDEVATLTKDVARAEGAASTCSASVASLGTKAIERAATAAAERAAAGTAAALSADKADAILSQGATTPGDDCKSATDRVKRLLKGQP